MTEDVFGAWQADRAAGLDLIHARPHPRPGRRAEPTGPRPPPRRHRSGPRHCHRPNPSALRRQRGLRRRTHHHPRERPPAAHLGDRLGQNGDRWNVLEIHDDGDLTVQHTRHGRTVRLPSDYVAQATVGYACTVHTAQGVTADSMHGLATGTESRQQLYTMMTRGALANHVYLEVVGDGDPHSVIHPTLVRPLGLDRHPQVDPGSRRRTTVGDQPHPGAGRPSHPARRSSPALPRQPLRRGREPASPRHHTANQRGRRRHRDQPRRRAGPRCRQAGTRSLGRGSVAHAARAPASPRRRGREPRRRTAGRSRRPRARHRPRPRRRSRLAPRRLRASKTPAPARCPGCPPSPSGWPTTRTGAAT